MWTWVVAILLAAVTTLPVGGRDEDPERVRRMLVPPLRTLDVATARSLVQGAGLRLEVHPVVGTACRPEGEVLAQRPPPNAKLPLGSRVRVEVNLGAMGRCGLRLPPTTPSLEQTARAFVEYAVGRADFPPADTPITLYLGGTMVATVLPDSPRTTWRVCLENGVGYAGFVCPFSALEHVARTEQLAITSQPPTHPCAHPRELPGAPYSVTITPDESLDCTSYWGVQLLVNRVNQLIAVNLVRSEP